MAAISSRDPSPGYSLHRAGEPDQPAAPPSATTGRPGPPRAGEGGRQAGRGPPASQRCASRLIGVVVVRVVWRRAACLVPEGTHRLAGNAVAEATPLQERRQLRAEGLVVGSGEGTQAVAVGVHHGVARLAVHAALA